MFIHLFDQNEYYLVFHNPIYCPIRSTQSNRPLPFSIALQWFVMKARPFPHLFKSKAFNPILPCLEFYGHMRGNFLKVFGYSLAEKNPVYHKGQCTPIGCTLQGKFWFERGSRETLLEH